MTDKTDETYDPSTVEVDRGRGQGLGMGEKDLQRQRDPGYGLSAEERASSVNEDGNDDAADALGRSQPA